MKNRLMILATAILAINTSAAYAAENTRMVKYCDAGIMMVCTSLGLAYATGKDVKQDYLKASKFFQQACDGGSMEGCFYLGVVYENGKEVKQDYSKAKALLSKSCKSGLPQGCDWDKELTEKGY